MIFCSYVAWILTHICSSLCSNYQSMTFYLASPWYQTPKLKYCEDHKITLEVRWRRLLTLMLLTRLAVLLATSFADCTKCFLATGLLVFDEATRHILHRAEVCLATSVAAAKTWNDSIKNEGPYLSRSFQNHPIHMLAFKKKEILFIF